MSTAAAAAAAAALPGDARARRPSYARHGSSVSPASFLSSLRALSFDEIQDLPSSIAAKHAAVESNLSRLAVQHIDSVLDARDAAASLPALRTSLCAKLHRLQEDAVPGLAEAVRPLPAQAQPAVLKYERSDTLAKTLADEEALSLLLHAPVTVKNLVSAATAGGALLGSTTTPLSPGAGGRERAPSMSADSFLPEDGVLDAGVESGSQAASAALSITMRLFALAAEGSVLLSSSSSAPRTTGFIRRNDNGAETIDAAGRSLHSIATESLMHLHSLKLFLIQRTLHDVHLKLADAIRAVTMIRHMRTLRPQGVPSSSEAGRPATDASKEARSPAQKSGSTLDELGLSEPQLMLAFFQARASALRTALATPPPLNQMAPNSTGDLPPDFEDLLTRAKPGPTTWTIWAWKEQVSRALSIAASVFEASSSLAQDSTASGRAGHQEGQEMLPLLRSSFASSAVRLLGEMLEEGEVEEVGKAGGEVAAQRPPVRLRAREESGVADGRRPGFPQERRKAQERIAMALHMYTYSLRHS